MALLDRLKNSWVAFKTSVAFLGRDKSLWAIPFLSGLVFLVFICLFGLLILGGGFAGASSLRIYGLMAVLLFVMLFISAFFNAAFCWMVHEVALGKDTTVGSGMKRAKDNLKDILLFSLAMLAIKLITGALRGKRNPGFDLTSVARGWLASAIEVATGIAAKLVVPAMIITDRSFLDSVKQLRQSIKALPEIGVYEIGIKPLMGLLMGIVLLVTVLAVFAVPGVLPFFIIIDVLLLVALGIFISLLDKVYYTLVYLTLIEGKKIPGLHLIGSK